MALALKQQMKLSQQLVMTPQLQQAIKLLQLSRVELEDVVKEQLLENPVLEEFEPEAAPVVEPTVTPDKGEVTLDETPALSAERAERQLENFETKNDAREHERDTSLEESRVKDGDWEAYLDQYSNWYVSKTTIQRDDDLPTYDQTVTRGEGLNDYLAWQLQLTPMADQERVACTAILGNINDAGYLTENLEEIAVRSDLPLEILQDALSYIQECDPIGIAARDLPECLTLQAKRMIKEEFIDDGELLLQLIERHLTNVEKRNYQLICKDLAIDVERLKELLALLSQMDPRPGEEYQENSTQYVVPDVYVEHIGGDYVVRLNDDGLPKLRIGSFYRRILQDQAANKGTKEFVDEKMKAAFWLIRSIDQRQRTIKKVTESIVKFQREFFDHGINYLKPLILRDVANDIGMHESTVSRVTTNKYVHTPQGIFELKYFFNSSISRTNGYDLASEAVKNKIRKIVDSEDPKHPLSDQAIVNLLRQDKIEIARRTVAKYREMMGVLPSSRRKKLL